MTKNRAETWTLIFTGLGAGVSLVVAISASFWLIITLYAGPIKEDVAEIKQQINCKLKSEDELKVFFFEQLATYNKRKKNE